MARVVVAGGGPSSVSIVIPAYNEEKRILGTLESYFRLLSGRFWRFEIIVVANNCGDNTAEFSRDFASSHKGVSVLEFKHYTGKGGAVIEGFRKAKGEIIGFVDADNSTKPEEFFRLFSALQQGFDVAVGSRGLPDSELVKKQPLHRLMLGKAFHSIVEALFGLGIYDTQCGAKVFRRPVVEKILCEKVSSGFEFDVQMLWIAKRAGFRIKEVGIAWENSEDSKVSLSDPLKMLFGLARLRAKGA